MKLPTRRNASLLLSALILALLAVLLFLTNACLPGPSRPRKFPTAPAKLR